MRGESVFWAPFFTKNKYIKPNVIIGLMKKKIEKSDISARNSKFSLAISHNCSFNSLILSQNKYL